MSDMLTNAGAAGYLLIAGTLVGLLAAAGFGGMAFTKRRVPLVAFMLLPYLMLAVGAFAAWANTSLAIADVAAAPPATIPIVAMSGAWGAVAVDWVSRWAAAIVLVAGTWAAAVGAFAVPGPEPKFTFVASIGAAVSAVVGALGVVIYAAVKGLSGGAYMLALIVLAGGLGVAVAASRRAADDEMFRVAGMRFVASLCTLFAIFHSIRAVDMGNRVGAFAADSPLMTATDVIQAVDLYSALTTPGVTVGVGALIAGLAIAFFGFFAEIGEVVVRYTVFDMFATVALMVFVGVIRILESLGFNAIYVLATNEPAAEWYHEIGSALPAAVITSNDVGVVTRFVEGGFGDVVAYENDEWVRRYEWTGKNWWEDDTPLSKARLSRRPPLVAVERSLPADKLLEVLEKTADGEIYLMLRASEAKAGAHVPQELQRLQTTFLPLKLQNARDLKTQLWLEAGAPEANWGPTTWFGEKDDSLDVVEYAGAALTGTGSLGVNLVVQHRKVGDVVSTCLPYMVDKVGETAPAEPTEEGAEAPVGPTPVFGMNAGRWCAVVTEDYETLRKEASDAWPMPEPPNVTLTTSVEGGLLQEEVDGFVRRELGGIGWCAQKAVEGGEELKGKMTLFLAVGRDGGVYDTLVDEKSKVQSPAIKACAAKRFRKMQFTPPPPPTEPPAPVNPRKPPPPPVVPKAIVEFDFVTP